MGRVVRGAKCPWGKMSVGRIVHGANCPWGEMSVGRNVRGAKCPWGEMSVGRDVVGRVVLGRVVLGRVVLGRVVLGRVVREPVHPAGELPECLMCVLFSRFSGLFCRLGHLNMQCRWGGNPRKLRTFVP